MLINRFAKLNSREVGQRVLGLATIFLLINNKQ